ncbi:hypothetical protein [Humidisolicoccus flavus]|uniref:hypothetical protein n=1 Tax=Humidisolicoccus flavus TaxID=3111414 RepID=UPI0032460C8B
MPRKSHQRRAHEHVPLEVERILGGAKRTEVRRGFEYFVQPVTKARALKEYTCPGCSVTVKPGVAHLVVWRADSIFGDRAVEDRRHWHEGCWKVA